MIKAFQTYSGSTRISTQNPFGYAPASQLIERSLAFKLYAPRVILQYQRPRHVTINIFFNVWEGMGRIFFWGVVTDVPQNTQVQIKMPSITNRDQKSATYQFIKAKQDVLTFLGLMQATAILVKGQGPKEFQSGYSSNQTFLKFEGTLLLLCVLIGWNNEILSQSLVYYNC